MTRLLRLLTRSDRHTGVLLAGPSGVGKTRLANDALVVLANSYRVVRVMVTWPDEDMPQSSMAKITRTGRTDVVSVPAHELLQALRPTGNSRQDTVLFVDDAHLLEPAMASLILDLARQQAAYLLLIVNTDAPLPAAITALWKDDLLHRMELGPLDEVSTRRLAASLVGDGLARSAATYLAQLSDGNPLLLRELVRAAAQQGLFAPSPGGWTLPDQVPLSVPLSELITRKIRDLEPEARDALELVVLAEPVPLDLLERLVPAPTLLHLENQDLLHVEASRVHASEPPKAIVRLSHQLVGHVIRQTMPVLRCRAHLRVWIAAYSDRTEGSDAETLRITNWRLEVGDSVSTEELLHAAHRAAAANDLAMALRFTAAAWHQQPSSRTAAAHALALISLADFDAATTVLDAAETACAEQCPELQAARARGFLLQGRFDRAEDIIAGLTGSQGRLFHGMASYFQGNFNRTLQFCGPLIDNPADEHYLEAVIFQMAALLHAGHPADALALYEGIVPRDGIDAHPFHADCLELVHAATLAALGRLKEAAALLAHAYDRAVADRHLRIDAQYGLALSAVLLEHGRPRQACELSTFHPGYQVGWEQWHTKAQLLTTLANASVGRPGKADLPQPVDSSINACHHIALAWTAFLSGERNHAAALLTRAADTGQERGGHGDVAVICHEMARLGLADHTQPYWDTIVQGPYLQARLDYAKSIVNADIRLLRRTAETFVQAGAELFAAEAYAELSRLHRRSNQDRAATAASHHAQSLASRCEGATTPALLLLESLAPLSLREREMMLLVAQGLSDREIAERLTLSVRTVGNHLYRIYRKIGVTSRRELQRAVPTNRGSSASDGPI
ncbi:LuxR C-terminal-related transcriptional regulator [Streptomyces sp. CA-251387]|uniref:helix-turn-helix transcriptional regulator n=1 Tax=Streptomyces sp. CA-251387 TaxID=3240064 RepID=UPI003D908751